MITKTMKITLFVLPIILILASCAPGTGGYQLDAYALNGTSTAVAATATSTAVSGNSTRLAAEYATGISSTATAVQVTATAAAIGTAKAQITNAEAIATLEKAQIENAIAWDGATATAVHNQLLTNQATARAARAEQTAVWWVWVRWAFLGLIILAGIVLIIVGGYAFYKRAKGKDTAVVDKDGYIVGLHTAYRMLPASTSTIIDQRPSLQPAPTPDDTALRNGEEFHKLVAPTVLEYANQKVTLSDRQINKLRQWVMDGDYGLRRDPSPEGHCFREIGINSGSYGLTLSVLQGRGYVSDDAPYRWTDRGLTELLGLVLSD